MKRFSRTKISPPPPPPPPPPEPEQAWKTLLLVNDWIKHAEAKTAATLAASGVAGGVLYNLVGRQSCPPTWLVIVEVCCGVAVVVAAGAALVALLPRLRSPRQWFKRSPPAPPNLVYFSSIAKTYPDGQATLYGQEFRNLTLNPSGLVDQIAQQIHANSHVARRKYRWINVAIPSLGVALALLGTTAAMLALTAVV